MKKDSSKSLNKIRYLNAEYEIWTISFLDPFEDLDYEIYHFFLSCAILTFAISFPFVIAIYSIKIGISIDVVFYNSTASTILAFLFACIIYRIRQRRPLIYGGFEVGIGAATFFYTTRAENSDMMLVVTQLSAGIYIMVRGLDNISKTFVQESKTFKIWRRIFYEPVISTKIYLIWRFLRRNFGSTVVRTSRIRQ